MKTSLADTQTPAMEVIAEVCCSPHEVRKILTAHAEKFLAAKSDWWWADNDPRKTLIAELHKFCDQHHYARFQRRKTIMDVAKRALSRRMWASIRREKRETT